MNPVRLFVVCAPGEDEVFVNSFLLQALKLPEAEVMILTRPEIGALIVDELERGALSTLTVVVLSPAFQGSVWAKFASKLAVHQSVEKGSQVVPLVLRDCEQGLLTQFWVALDFRDLKRSHWEKEVGKLRKKLRKKLRAAVPPEEGARCPYPGMRAFEEKDASAFYGRKQEVREALGYLRTGVRELYVIGPSGSGKSSLVAAGLVPEVQRAPALAGGRYVVRTMRPGAEPVAALAAALEEAPTAVSDPGGSNPELIEAPEGSPARRMIRIASALVSDPTERSCEPAEKAPRGEHIETRTTGGDQECSEAKRGEPAGRWKTALARLLARNVGHDRVLLVVDQLEELFTTAKGAARRGFEEALRELRKVEQVVLVLTLRADFYGALMESVLWEDAGGRRTHLEVAPLRAVRLREAIEEPARSLKVYYEQVLVEQLLREVEDEVGALPLLQDTLLELWHERTHGLVRLADYEALGEDGQTGLATIVKERANAALSELAPSQRALARRVLLRLVQFGEGEGELVTRRQQRWAALSAAGDGEGEVESVVRHLAARRLVTTSGGEESDGGARVDLAHEVLLTAWPTLGEWIRTRRADEQRRRVLEGKAAEWVRRGRGKTWLLYAEELAEMRGWLTQEVARELGPSEDALELVAASALAEQERAAELVRQRRQLEEGEQERRRHRRFRRVVLTVIPLVSSGLGLWQWQRRGEQREEARQKATLNQLNAVRAAASLARQRPQELGNAVNAALGAMSAPGVEPSVSLPEALLELAQQRASLPVRSAAVSGTVLGISLSSGLLTAVVWRADNKLVVLSGPREALREEVIAETADHPIVAVSPRGTWIAYASDGSLRFWNVAGHAWHRDGVRLQPPGAAPSAFPATPWLVTFSGDEASAAVAFGDPGSIDVWEVESLTRRTPTLPLDGRAMLALDSRGEHLIAGAARETWDVTFVDVVQGSRAPLIGYGTQSATTATFSRDGRWLAVGTSEGIGIWSLESGRPFPHRKSGKRRGNISSIAFSEQGARLAAGTNFGEKLVWSFSDNPVADESLRHLSGSDSDYSQPVTALAFSGETIAAASNEHSSGSSSGSELHFWDLGSPLELYLRHGDAVTSLATSPSGSWLVTGSRDRTARVWSTSTGAQRAQLLRPLPVLAVAAHGSWFAAAGADRTIELIGQDGQKYGPGERHLSAVLAVSIAFDGLVATASADGTARILHPRGEAPPIKLVHSSEKQGDELSPDLPELAVTDVAWSPRGEWLATAGNNGVVEIWNRRGERQSEFNHGGEIRSLAWSPDGMLVLSSGADGAAKLWWRDGSAVRVLDGHQRPVLAGRFAPDGRMVVTTSEDGTARIWSVPEGRLLQTLTGHDGAVRDAAFAPRNCNMLATVGDDRTLRLWSTRSWQERARFVGSAEHVIFLDSGGRVASGGTDGYVRIMPTCTRPALDALCEMRDRIGGTGSGSCPLVNEEECCP